MVLNIKFYASRWVLQWGMLLALSVCTVWADSDPGVSVGAEPVLACVVRHGSQLTPENRVNIANCLGWDADFNRNACHGSYRDVTWSPQNGALIQINADKASLYSEGHSMLSGHVEVIDAQRMVTAQTAILYRDPRTHEVTEIKLQGGVRYLEPGKIIWAKKVRLNPHDDTGQAEHVLYRVDQARSGAMLPAWGTARDFKRLRDKSMAFNQVTYTTCPLHALAWQIEAQQIILDHVRERGLVKDATFRVEDWPIAYIPYFTFPTSNKRKTGFLMPSIGYSNLRGADFSAPFYWNMAPNYDATIVPHGFTRRGVMLESDLRFLTSNSNGVLSGSILPADQAYRQFLAENQTLFPQLKNQSDNRWSYRLLEDSQWTEQLHMHVNYQRVSDNYYLQDFSNNLAVITENQLQQQLVLDYNLENWQFKGTAEAYQTLNPVNQASVSPIYERIPQLVAHGVYDDLPWNGHLDLEGQFDAFRWPNNAIAAPQGLRYHGNPALSFALNQPWGYVNPQVQWVGNFYQLQDNGVNGTQQVNYSIPRISVDSGLYFDRHTALAGRGYTQTLEPRVFYLHVPYHDQSNVPAFDSAYMIFSTEQLFRMNRFSGIDRIGDANQMAYALTSRWLLDATGREKASVSIGQLRYFSQRRVQLCYQQGGHCTDDVMMLGYLSPTEKTSPIASHAMLQFNPSWRLNTDYNWNAAQRVTNNADFNLDYTPNKNQLLRFGYSYLVNGNMYDGVNRVPGLAALNQSTIAAAWPLTSTWSGLGIWSYNISQHYDMMTFAGLQYDSCCFAVRLFGGRIFDSLSTTTLTPKYNNNAYVQVLFKGLGSVGNRDPVSILESYLPGYVNLF